ncbi:unnamed protein product [Brassicogethes aeneus]|uniref:Uncharacterized protein n=1 Tax=Brassicogethes aeneus TaxID=1431903 RepID=A0A9P0B619_BRAAE|nr:unnamed protein product [Brassicogethes aeneus]
MDNGPKKFFKLIRRNGLPPAQPKEVIKKNLEPLLQNIEKKKYAQEVYYKENPKGVSPLIRKEKGSVRQRLGQTLKYKRLTNTANISPKSLYKIQRCENYPMNKKRFSAQDRLNRIRQSQLYFLNNNNEKKTNTITLRRTNQFKNTPRNVLQRGVPYQRKFKLRLNQQLMTAILNIQSQYHSMPLYMEDYICSAEATDLKLNNRFSSY